MSSSTGGAIILVMIFVAITSASSAELIAVSAIMEYDIYRVLINPNATDEQQRRFGRFSLIGFSIFMGVAAVILNLIGIDLGFLYLFMGVLIGSAVVPIALTLAWKRQSAIGAIAGAVSGLVCGVSGWLISAYMSPDGLTLAGLDREISMLIGNLLSILVSAAVTCIISMICPPQTDDDPWERLTTQIQSVQPVHITEQDRVQLRKAAKTAVIIGSILTLILLICWPIPLIATQYVFSQAFFSFWIVLALSWAILAALFIILMPIIEARSEIRTIFQGMYLDLKTCFKLTHEQIYFELHKNQNQNEMELQKQKENSDQQTNENPNPFSAPQKDNQSLLKEAAS